MDLPNDLTNMTDSQAYKQLEVDIEKIVTTAGFGLQIASMATTSPTLETPFQMSRIHFLEDWLEQHLGPVDYQKLMSISAVFDYWYVHLFDEERSPDGVHIYYSYLPYKYKENDFAFLMEYGNEETKQLYRLPALFSTGTGLELHSLNLAMFCDYIYQTGDKLVEHLNEKLTTLVTPLRLQLEARIETFKQEYAELSAVQKK